MRTGVAYKLTFPNGKVYIGITREPLARRVQRHVYYARAGRKFALSAAIRKHGETSFSSEVIGSGSWDELKSIEIAAIAEHKLSSAGCYNMTGGGDGSLGVSLTEETKAKIAASLRGRKCAEAHCKNVSEAQKGKTIPADVRKKMSDAAKARALRSPMTDEQKQKIGLALKGKKHSQERIEARVKTRRETMNNAALSAGR